MRPTCGRAVAPTSSRKLPHGKAVVWSSNHRTLVCSCAHDCDAELTGCTAATVVRISSRLSAQWRRAPTGVRPTCGRAVAPTSSRKLLQGEAVVRSSNHRTRVLLCSRLRRQADRLHCGHCHPYLQSAERTVEACPDRRETNVRSSNRTNELAQTAARRGRRVVEQSSYSCALVLTTATPS